MILGRVCSCSTLQCGQVKSEYRSMRKGAAGLPTLLLSGPAARQGSIRASVRANIFILLCYTKQLHTPLEGVVPESCVDSVLRRCLEVDVCRCQQRLAQTHFPGRWHANGVYLCRPCRMHRVPGSRRQLGYAWYVTNGGGPRRRVRRGFHADTNT